jgi:hypothetical protein
MLAPVMAQVVGFAGRFQTQGASNVALAKEINAVGVRATG